MAGWGGFEMFLDGKNVHVHPPPPLNAQNIFVAPLECMKDIHGPPTVMP